MKKTKLGQLVRSLIYNERLFRMCERYMVDFWAHRYRRTHEHYDHPVWFMHRLDLARWPFNRNPYFLERGFLTYLAIPQGAQVLDLCCGDGFYPYFFYSNMAEHIDALDIDPLALEHAKRYHSQPNISYHLTDIVKQPFPRESYDVVAWDSAIRRLALPDIHTALAKVVEALRPTNGTFSAYEVFESAEDIKYITPLKAEEMVSLLGEYFESVDFVETEFNRRRNLYFHCQVQKTGEGGFFRKLPGA